MFFLGIISCKGVSCFNGGGGGGAGGGGCSSDGGASFLSGGGAPWGHIGSGGGFWKTL